MDGIFGANEPCKIAHILDGTSNTLMVGEATGAGAGTYMGQAWVSANIYDTRDGINGPNTVLGGTFPGMDPSKPGQNVNDSGFSSYHPGGCNFMLADGSVSFLSQNISQNILAALTTRAGPSPRNISLYGVSPVEIPVSGPP